MVCIIQDTYPVVRSDGVPIIYIIDIQTYLPVLIHERIVKLLEESEIIRIKKYEFYILIELRRSYKYQRNYIIFLFQRNENNHDTVSSKLIEKMLECNYKIIHIYINKNRKEMRTALFRFGRNIDCRFYFTCDCRHKKNDVKKTTAEFLFCLIVKMENKLYDEK